MNTVKSMAMSHNVHRNDGVQSTLWLENDSKDTDAENESDQSKLPDSDGAENDSDTAGGLTDRTAARLKKLKSKLSRHKKDDPNIYPLY